MGTAIAQEFARQQTGTEWTIDGDLHALCDLYEVPVGQLAERLGVLSGFTPEVAAALLFNGDAQTVLAYFAALPILRRADVEAHVYTAGADGAIVYGLQTGNYTLSDGSTGYSAVDGSAGLVLDGMGAQSTVVSIGSTSAGVTASGASIVGLGSNVSVVQGRAYRVEFTITACVGQLSAGLGAPNGTTQAINFVGSFSETLFAASTTTAFIGLWARGGASLTSVTGSVTATEVTGIHASQPTTANKPAVRRGALNLLMYSQDWSNAAWTKTNVTISGNKLVETVAAGTHNIAETQTTTSGVPYTIAVECSAAERNYIGVYAGTPAQGVIFNLTTGAYFGNLVGAPTSYSIVPTGTGTYLCVINYTATGAASAPSVYVCDGTGAFSYTGVATNGINVAKVGHFQGTLTAAQTLSEGGIPLTTTAAASNPSAGRYWWGFDKTDSIAMSAPAFQMADDSCTIVAMFCPAATPSDAYFVNPACGAANQLVSSLAFKTNGALQAAWVTDAAAQIVAITDGVNRLNQPVVATAVKRTSAKQLRINGAQAGVTDNTVISTPATVSAGVIGGFNVANSSLQAFGNTSIVIAVKGTLSDSDMLTLERFAASTLPNAPVF